MSDNNTVTLTIDDREITVPAGTVIADAAKQMGIAIPVFCHHPKLKPAGMCRMCLVEVGTPRTNRTTGATEMGWWPKLQTACTTEVSAGMAVRTQSEAVREAQRGIIEFLLTSHPLDCPICDKGGECPLQNQTMSHGVSGSRFYLDDKLRLGKRVPLGELIFLDQERCILCGRCIRFAHEIADDPVIAFHERGRRTHVISLSEPGFDSLFSGNTTDICPVGALTTADFRFGSRPWEMMPVATICTHCPVGCNMAYDVRLDRKSGREVIKRVRPRQNEHVNEIWLCDKGRFAHHAADHPERLRTPKIRRHGNLVDATWGEALNEVISQLKAGGANVAGIAGGRLSNEDLFAFRRLFAGLGSDRLASYPANMGGGDLVAQVGVGTGTDFATMGPETAILVAATDLHEEAPIWWLRIRQAAERGAKLIVLNGRRTRLDLFAAHVIRYAYGEEATALGAMLGAVKPKPGRAVEGLDEVMSAAAEFEADKDIKAAARAFAEAENAVAIVGSEGLYLSGSRALAQAAANLLMATGHTGRPNNGLMVVWPGANVQAAVDLSGDGYAEMLRAAEEGRAGAVVIAGADPAYDDPAAARALRDTKATVVVLDTFLTATAQLADVVLPVQSAAERDGTYTNGERRVQRFYPAIPACGEARPDWVIFESVREALGLGKATTSAAGILAEMAESAPQYANLSYRQLAAVEPQWPPVGGDDLYYSGTVAPNKSGTGIQWPAAAEDPSVTLRMAPPAVGAPLAPKGSELVIVPIRLLYDREAAFSKTALLAGRTPEPHIVLNPADAARLSLSGGDTISFEFEGESVHAAAIVSEKAPPGAALLPIRLQPGTAPGAAFVAALAKVEVTPA